MSCLIYLLVTFQQLWLSTEDDVNRKASVMLFFLLCFVFFNWTELIPNVQKDFMKHTCDLNATLLFLYESFAVKTDPVHCLGGVHSFPHMAIKKPYAALWKSPCRKRNKVPLLSTVSCCQSKPDALLSLAGLKNRLVTFSDTLTGWNSWWVGFSSSPTLSFVQLVLIWPESLMKNMKRGKNIYFILYQLSHSSKTVRKSCPWTQRQTGTQRDLNRQPFDHCTTHTTSLATTDPKGLWLAQPHADMFTDMSSIVGITP